MCHNKMFRLLFGFILVSLTRAMAKDKIEIETSRALITDCVDGIFSASCLKFKALMLIEKLDSKEELRLFPGMSIVKEFNATNDNDVTTAIAKSLGDKDEKMNKFLVYKLGSYLESHSVKFKLFDGETSGSARVLDGGGKGGKKDGMGAMMAMAAMMKGDMMSMGMSGLAMMAGKSLATAMLAFLLSALMGMKVMGGGQMSTYEVIKPHYDDGGSYGHSSGWDRKHFNVIKRR